MSPRLNPGPLSYAQIEWQDQHPESTEFGDIYFSRDDGLAETEYVFLEGNQLGQRFAELDQNSVYVIAETGFGTGLNFLAARQLWHEQAQASARLHYISCEKYPLRAADLRTALQRFQAQVGFDRGIEQLLEQWPDAIEGFHSIYLDEGQIQLTLLFGDASVQLSQLNAQVDTWFLDGFAPAKNADLWSDALFEQIARLSHTGTRAATFTAAGIVKRGLQGAGFTVQKIKGFGRKREMITALCAADPREHKSQQPWLTRPPLAQVERVAIIGAGLAGATTAYALSRRGIAVDLYEREEQIAIGGSGNPQGALYIKLPAKPTLAGEFHLRGTQFTARLIRALGLNDLETADLCGLLQLAPDAKEAQRQQQLIESGRFPESFLHSVDEERASQLAGIPVTQAGLHWPTTGWVAPGLLARKLIELSGARVYLNCEVRSLTQQGSGWRINEQMDYTQVVLCSAWETRLIESRVQIPLKPIRGQTSWCAADPNNPALNKVICSKGYISPPSKGQYCFGSSFKPGDASVDLRPEEHQHNLELLRPVLPSLAEQFDTLPLTGKAACRAGSPDYLPLVGPLCSTEGLHQQYAELSVNAKAQFDDQAPWLRGLYVNLGHGSKGLASCPVSAELLAAQICNEPLPMEQDLVDLLSPQRFTIRELKRSTS